MHHHFSFHHFFSDNRNSLYDTRQTKADELKEFAIRSSYPQISLTKKTRNTTDNNIKIEVMKSEKNEDEKEERIGGGKGSEKVELPEEEEIEIEEKRREERRGKCEIDW